MNIGLIDVDGRVKRGGKTNGKRYPNLALMKLSAWHKAQGDIVEWCFPMKRYDRVYASKVFTFTPDLDYSPLAEEFITGGTGYGLGGELPPEVEHMMPDYDLYGDSSMAYGFLSRGCPRGCPFCIVSRKEGRASRKVADLREWWDGHKRIEILDPNILACPEWRDLLGQLADSRANVCFSQGLDIRFVTEDKVELLNRVRAPWVHFAWDGNEDLTDNFKRWGGALRWRYQDRRVYVLCNYNTTMEWNLHRIYTLREMGYDPFVMVFGREGASHEIRRLARWVNQKAVFRKCPRFEDYK